MKRLVKFISLVLALVFACAVLPACNYEYDRERDFMQVAVTVAAYEIKDPTGAKDSSGNVKTYVADEYNIYKYQLANLVNSYYSYIEAGYYTLDQLIQQVVSQRLLTNAAYAYKDFGLIRWSQYEEDMLTDYKFDTLDSYIEAQKEEICKDAGEQYIPVTDEQEEEEDTATTYPVYTDNSRQGFHALTEDQLRSEIVERGIVDSKDAAGEYTKYTLIKMINDDLKSAGYYVDENGAPLTIEELKTEAKACGMTDAQVADLNRYELIAAIDDYYYAQARSRKYSVSLSRIPGISADDDKASLENTAMERVISNLKTTLKDARNVTGEDQAKIDKAWEAVDKAVKDEGMSKAYIVLGQSFVMEYLVGRTYREQILVTLLQEYIESTVSVTTAEVESSYASKLNEQRNSYANNETAYTTALDNDETVIYHPVINGYYVKHILIPFSDAQSASLSDYANTSVSNQYDNKEEYRASLAEQIMGYAHVDGEESGDAMDINTIYNDIVKQVTEASLINKDKVFSSLIYKYSTDTASVGKRFGYKEVIEGTSSYMPEFADAAKELFEKGKVGDISGKVVTDYGVHVLMLVRTNKEEAIVGLDQKASASDNLTVREYIEDELYGIKANEIFSKWTKNNINDIVKGDSVTYYTNRYNNIIAEMTE